MTLTPWQRETIAASAAQAHITRTVAGVLWIVGDTHQAIGDKPELRLAVTRAVIDALRRVEALDAPPEPVRRTG